MVLLYKINEETNGQRVGVILIYTPQTRFYTRAKSRNDSYIHSTNSFLYKINEETNK